MTLAEPRSCEVCYRLFRPLSKNVRRGYGKTCSAQCRSRKAQQHTPVRRGPDAPGFRHGHFVNNKSDRIAKRAHNAVQWAISRGQLSRGPCVTCGSTVKVHGHHPDYSKPLDVIWLCEPCHKALHAAEHAA